MKSIECVALLCLLRAPVLRTLPFNSENVVLESDESATSILGVPKPPQLYPRDTSATGGIESDQRNEVNEEGAAFGAVATATLMATAGAPSTVPSATVAPSAPEPTTPPAAPGIPTEKKGLAKFWAKVKKGIKKIWKKLVENKEAFLQVAGVTLLVTAQAMNGTANPNAKFWSTVAGSAAVGAANQGVNGAIQSGLQAVVANLPPPAPGAPPVQVVIPGPVPGLVIPQTPGAGSMPIAPAPQGGGGPRPSNVGNAAPAAQSIRRRKLKMD
ncbi:hypothetical protein HK102_005090 [Quaeritorhiza haematococci]|nr:hypothetical protein HK102_005090 [Quaeritorhiza haematococci]